MVLLYLYKRNISTDTKLANVFVYIDLSFDLCQFINFCINKLIYRPPYLY